MPSSYPYLISSLPMLHFGAKPPFSSQSFIETCRDLIPDKDLDIVNRCLGETFLEENADQETLRKWVLFEAGLRNELVKIRASRRKIEPAKYLRSDGYWEPALYHIAMNSHRILSLVESEKFLDQERWRRLEELSFGHYFDLDALIIYALKLQILWRWEKVARTDKAKILESVLSGN